MDIVLSPRSTCKCWTEAIYFGGGGVAMYFIAFFHFFSFLPPQKYCDTNRALCLTMFAVKVVQSM